MIFSSVDSPRWPVPTLKISALEVGLRRGFSNEPLRPLTPFMALEPYEQPGPELSCFVAQVSMYLWSSFHDERSVLCKTACFSLTHTTLYRTKWAARWAEEKSNISRTV